MRWRREKASHRDARDARNADVTPYNWKRHARTRRAGPQQGAMRAYLLAGVWTFSDVSTNCRHAGA
jgi:hypothetical protein